MDDPILDLLLYGNAYIRARPRWVPFDRSHHSDVSMTAWLWLMDDLARRDTCPLLDRLMNRCPHAVQRGRSVTALFARDGRMHTAYRRRSRSRTKRRNR